MPPQLASARVNSLAAAVTAAGDAAPASGNKCTAADGCLTTFEALVANASAAAAAAEAVVSGGSAASSGGGRLLFGP